jgi:peptidylprolyl isomerase
MAQVKKGDTVKVHYTGKLNDGTVFDTSINREPLMFTIGQGNMIPGFEQAVLGMSVGDSKVANIPSTEAYGEKKDEMMVDVPRTQVPANIEPEVGMQLAVQQPDGSSIPVTITEVSEEKIVLDANHPLAGKDLIFEIELVEIA